jgi:hypothetical protein
MAAALVGSEEGGAICSRSYYHTPIVGQLTDAVNPLSSSLRTNVMASKYQQKEWCGGPAPRAAFRMGVARTRLEIGVPRTTSPALLPEMGVELPSGLSAEGF